MKSIGSEFLQSTSARWSGGTGHSFAEHPTVVHIASGEVLARWPDLASGNQLGSIRLQGIEVLVDRLTAEGYPFGNPMAPMSNDAEARACAVSGPPLSDTTVTLAAVERLAGASSLLSPISGRCFAGAASLACAACRRNISGKRPWSA